MNMSPQWCTYLQSFAVDVVHWSQVGELDATDSEIMKWAVNDQRIVLTNDLDFGTILAISGATGPSVIQTRGQDLSPLTLGPAVIAVRSQFAAQLDTGALITIPEDQLRVRVLPFGQF